MGILRCGGMECALSIWPANTRFHRVRVPSTDNRQGWAEEMKRVLQGANLIFLDPDNGVGETERHATLAEVKTMRQSGRAIVLIKFPGRDQSYGQQLKDYHGLLRDAGFQSISTVRTCVWLNQPRSRWFGSVRNCQHELYPPI
jgi:hypothetical protein